MMNIREGSRRMQVAGRMLALVGVALLVVGIVSSVLRLPILPAVGLGLWLLLAGVALWISGWIVDGFR